jgi:hypothetical protein
MWSFSEAGVPSIHRPPRFGGQPGVGLSTRTPSPRNPGDGVLVAGGTRSLGLAWLLVSRTPLGRVL